MHGKCLTNYQLTVLNEKKDILKFDESHIKNFDEDETKGYF